MAQVEEAASFTVTADTLGAISLFTHLDRQPREAIARQCAGRTYQPGEEVVSMTDTQHHVYFIVSGCVKVAVYSHSGREVVFRNMEASAMLGELAAIDDEPRSAYVYAVERSAVVVLSRARFLALLASDAQIAMGVMRHLVRLVRLLSQRVFEHDALKVGSRIHSELLRMADARTRNGNLVEIRPAPTDEAIARVIGTNRAAVNRELSKLRKSKLLEKRAGCLRILDLAALSRLAERHEDRYSSERSCGR